ncbi:MAG: L-ribulose-5-phosphate 4-epimerase [Tissierellia bacterium]|nr:L-ribulose-5-phosphate 4-epimerase [Tissierellia bacterium]
MFKILKDEVFNANLLLPKHNLITFTWGNVSQIDENREYVAIKPSGVEYDLMTADDIVVVDLEGRVIDGNLKPSSDTATHLELYKAFDDINGICHTHSRWATIFAQAKMGIEALGTTHADYFYGEIPITRDLTLEEVKADYEKETGIVIIECLKNLGIKPIEVPAVLVASHGPFTFGKSAENSVFNAVVLEEVAFMAWHNLMMDKYSRIHDYILDKHYLRKHGENSYYGQ